MEKPNIPFVEFPKISRISRAVVVTEKLDGTNAQIYISDDGQIHAGSRSRWIVPGDDNYGFAAWVESNKEELLKLGPGSHFGEWWGAGIQRKYNTHEKRFSLFNVSRWEDEYVRPKCCHVVPVLWKGSLDNINVSVLMANLEESGSIAAPGFMKPEGIVVFCTAGRQLFKKTFEKDEGKS